MTHIDRAVILAAGLGSRLKWMTNQRPKALMQIGGVPAITHVIRSLAAQGIHEIAVNAHHHAEQLADYLGNGERFGCNISISHEQDLLDSGGGVKKALSLLPGNGAVLVYNSDVLADIDVQHLARLLPEHGAAVALVDNPIHNRLGDFNLQGSNVTMNGYNRFTFSGVSVWDDAVFQHYDHNETFSLARSLRECMASDCCTGFLHPGYWFDIGRPRDLMRANTMLRAA
ncbi:nucleotidyltransferase family protein [Mariprofundus ferrooxydans]|nr:nucleotidyltransferase family protein [Mariprofundus ferrooxydans]